MTVLVLDKLWLNRLDTGEAIAAISSPTDRSQQFAKQVTVHEYASGRLRAISTGTASRGQLVYRLMNIDYATKEKLISWAGVAVQVRDYRGQKWFGTFSDVDVTEYEQPGQYTAGFTLTTITVVEGV
jgi:hypothetical protein